MRFVLALVWLTLLILFFGLPPLSAQQSNSPKRVLILSEFGHSTPAYRALENAMRAVVSASVPQGVRIYAEYLDAPSVDESGAFPAFRDYLRSRHATLPDVILSYGKYSFLFLLENGASLFPGVPVVFAADHGTHTAGRPLPKNFTGVSDSSDYAAPLELALWLQPETERVFVVMGASTWDQSYGRAARQQLARLERRLQFTYLSGLPMDVLEHTLATLPPRSVVSTETAPASEVSPDEAAIDQIRTDYIAHYNQAHPQIVAVLFTDSAWGLWADGSVTMGKPAIEASLQEELGTAPTPTLDIQNVELALFGDRAVGRGSYTVTVTPPQGAAATIGGSYLTYFVKGNDEWKIQGALTNFNVPPAEGTPLKEPEGEPPPEEGTMKEFIASYVQAYNAADWGAVANFYAEDAQVAFANLEPLSGRAAVQARFVERFGTNKPTLEVHDVGTVDLDATHKLDGGWYTLNAASPEGARMTQNGTFLSLLQQQADGSWKIKWSVTNGNPRPAA